jgi:hypothetical protein
MLPDVSMLFWRRIRPVEQLFDAGNLNQAKLPAIMPQKENCGSCVPTFANDVEIGFHAMLACRGERTNLSLLAIHHAFHHSTLTPPG